MAEGTRQIIGVECCIVGAAAFLVIVLHNNLEYSKPPDIKPKISRTGDTDWKCLDDHHFASIANLRKCQIVLHKKEAILLLKSHGS